MLTPRLGCHSRCASASAHERPSSSLSMSCAIRWAHLHLKLARLKAHLCDEADRLQIDSRAVVLTSGAWRRCPRNDERRGFRLLSRCLGRQGRGGRIRLPAHQALACRRVDPIAYRRRCCVSTIPVAYLIPGAVAWSGAGRRRRANRQVSVTVMDTAQIHCGAGKGYPLGNYRGLIHDREILT